MKEISKVLTSRCVTAGVMFFKKTTRLYKYFVQGRNSRQHIEPILR